MVTIVIEHLSFWHSQCMYLYRFNEFGVDGGPAAKELDSKLSFLKEHLTSKLGVVMPDVEVRYFIFPYYHI